MPNVTKKNLIIIKSFIVWKSNHLFIKNYFRKKKWIIVTDLCPMTLRSFVVQWAVKIAGPPPKLKPLPSLGWESNKQLKIKWLLIHFMALGSIKNDQKWVKKILTNDDHHACSITEHVHHRWKLHPPPPYTKWGENLPKVESLGST